MFQSTPSSSPSFKRFSLSDAIYFTFKLSVKNPFNTQSQVPCKKTSSQPSRAPSDALLEIHHKPSHPIRRYLCIWWVNIDSKPPPTIPLSIFKRMTNDTRLTNEPTVFQRQTNHGQYRYSGDIKIGIAFSRVTCWMFLLWRVSLSADTDVQSHGGEGWWWWLVNRYQSSMKLKSWCRSGGVVVGCEWYWDC